MYIQPPVKHFIAFYLKHTPLCTFENLRLTKPRRAHYSKVENRTVDILYCTPVDSPKLRGLPLSHELIVVSNMGGVVQRIGTNGRLIWQRKIRAPHGVEIFKNTVLVGHGTSLITMDIATGSILSDINFDQPVLAVRKLDTLLVVLFGVDGAGSVKMFTATGSTVKLLKTSPVPARFPRGVDFDNSYIYVADTFGHRVIKLDINSLSYEAEVSSYYPNSVQIVKNRIIVAEEHWDRVAEYEIPSLQLMRYEKLNRDTETDKIRREEEKCVAGQYGPTLRPLYSPNDAKITEETTIIADTDNHRVVEVQDGTIRTELIGFNSPVNVAVIRQKQ